VDRELHFQATHRDSSDMEMVRFMMRVQVAVTPIPTMICGNFCPEIYCSLLKDILTFAIAAFIAWILIVSKVISMMGMPDSTN
jgi:hypothetical protein